ncbi:MAG: hypothetical protein OEZ43_02585 [Gammaproteobacteria bacterium]|nr:hypothetical protein [Gammaproteobacteria bacterium]
MKTYRSYFWIAFALVLPLLYHVVFLDDRGGLPLFRTGKFIVVLISYLILISVSLAALYALLKGLLNFRENRRSMAHAGTKLAIIFALVVLPIAFNDQQRYGWDEEDLKKTMTVSIDGAEFSVPLKYW